MLSLSVINLRIQRLIGQVAYNMLRVRRIFQEGNFSSTWPCVRESIETLALALAILHIAPTNLSMVGNMTLVIASFNINACARLFMSSDVQAKWKNSRT